MLEESRAVPEGLRMDMGEYVSLLVERCRAAEAMRPAMDWMVTLKGRKRIFTGIPISSNFSAFTVGIACLPVVFFRGGRKGE